MIAAGLLTTFIGLVILFWGITIFVVKIIFKATISVVGFLLSGFWALILVGFLLGLFA